MFILKRCLLKVLIEGLCLLVYLFIREKALKRSNTVDIEVNIFIFIHFLKSLLAC